MKTILYATDFSENAENAFKYACELTKKTGAELVVLHVFDIPSIMDSDEPTFPGIERDIKNRHEKKLQSLCQQHLEEGEYRKLKVVVKENKSTVNGIVSMIEKVNADLVVMGIRGKSTFRELVMGSTAMGVIKKAGCPVLTVPFKGQYNELGNIVYSTDYEENDIQIINKLAELAGIFDAEITVIHISSDKEYDAEEVMAKYKKRLLENLSYPKLTFELLLSDDIYSSLNNYLLENKVMLLAMMEHEDRSIFEKWFHKDMVKRMEFHTSVPLLTFNQKYLAKIFRDEAELITKS